MPPRVSVVMAVRNGHKTLKEALDSILEQTFQDFEFIIIDDASDDATGAILRQRNDPRIIRIRNNTNLGLAASLNEGIRRAKGEYIARMDGDDVAPPNRFAIQVAFLDAHPAIGILGSSARLIGKTGQRKGRYTAMPTHTLIKWRSLFGSPMIHPSIMARRSILLANTYDETYRNSQDFELWSRLLFGSTVQFANLKKPLLLYRVHQDSTSSKRTVEQKELSMQTMFNNMARYTDLSDQEVQALRTIRLGEQITGRIEKIIFGLYRRLATSFISREPVTFKERFAIYRFLIQSKWFIWKTRIRSMLNLAELLPVHNRTTKK